MGDAPDRRVRSRRNWPFYALGLVVGVGAAVTGVLIAATHPSAHAHRYGALFVIVFAAVFAVLVGTVIVWSLRRQLSRPTMQRLRGFSFSERRAAARAVNAGKALTDRQQDIARAQLDQLRSTTTRIRWAMPVAVVAFGVLAITDAGGLRWFFAAIAALERLATTAVVLLLRRQVQRLDTALDGSSGSVR